jgi:hypothetical protein
VLFLPTRIAYLRTMLRRIILAHAALLAACVTDDSNAGASLDAARDSARVARADSIARARQDSINRAQPGYIVDSILPVEEEIRRFRMAVGGTEQRALTGGAASRDALVARFAAAVAARDTAALQAMAVNAREFIDLVYPSSPYTAPPYRQAPGFVWTQIQLPSGSGLRRLLERVGGSPLRIDALRCPATPERQGANRLHTECVVRFAIGAATPREGRLFGTILERDGRFKFVSYANMF